MKIKLYYLALGLLALLASFVVSSQRLSASEAPDRLAVSPATGPSVPGTGKAPLRSDVPALGVTEPYTTYLPLTTKNYTQGIYGYLTQGGVPIGGMSLELRVYKESVSDTLVTTTTTNPSGFYLFTGIPDLSGGFSYYVWYRNLEKIDSRLSSWFSRDVTFYTTSSSVNLGTSDLADVSLVSPAPSASVMLPHLFQWTPRPATPSDDYYWELYDPFFGTADAVVGPLYYSGTYTLNSLPSGFSPHIEYGWGVDLFDVNDGLGFSYYFYPITFSNSGASVHTPMSIAPRSTELQRHHSLRNRPER